ncbi:hypothetical protein DPMN_077552 [Dreissena polymorpha]|uniref:Uncharacterized protein n=1 Tax=Dreissena polymorpha TaxID=45954 RepID=A0A9D4BPF8_DREPO|nr:hypothetical protein DPMN_077552 [Dreissena polymorpha]
MGKNKTVYCSACEKPVMRLIAAAAIVPPLTTHWEAAICERRPILRNRCASSLVRMTGRRPASLERPCIAGRTRQGSSYRRLGRRFRLCVLEPISSSPVRSAEGWHMAFF